MPQDPPASSGGGPIYQDGNPVAESLAGGESVTVPSGETWVVTATGYPGSDPGRLQLNGSNVAQWTGDPVGFRLIADSGDTLKNSNGTGDNVTVTGWAL